MKLRLAAVAVVALLLSACATTTPRNGWSNSASVRAGRDAPGAALPDGAAAPAGTAASGAPAAGSSAATPSARAATASGSASGSTTGAGGGATSAAAATKFAPGVTDKTIAISVAMGFSGTYGAVSNNVYTGFQTWVNDVNARGGIAGRQVVAKKVDHQDSSAGGVAACKEMQSNDTYFGMFISGDGTANFTGPDCLDKAGRVNVSFVPSFDPHWKNTYGYMATAADEGVSLPSYIRSVVTGPGAKVGVIHLNLPAYTVAKDQVVAHAKSAGIEVVGTEAVDPNQQSFVAQLIRLRDKGANTLAIITTLEAVGVLRDAKAINWQPKITGIGWAFDFVTAAAGPTAQGARALRFSATIDSPAHAGYVQKAQAQGNTSALDGEAFLLYGVGQLAERILTGAGPAFTFASLRSSIEGIKGYDNQILPPLTWGPGDFAGTSASFPAECCASGNTWKRLGPAAETF